MTSQNHCAGFNYLLRRGGLLMFLWIICTCEGPQNNPKLLFDAVWAQRIGGDGDDSAYSVVGAPNGSFYVAGRVDGFATIGDPSNPEAVFEPPQSSTPSRYIAKYNSKNSIEWISMVGESLSTDSNYSNKLDVLNDGSALVSGHLNGTVVFGPEHEGAITLSGGEDASVDYPYLVSFGSAGEPQWGVVADASGWSNGNFYSMPSGRLVWIGVVLGSLSFAGETVEPIIIESEYEKKNLVVVDFSTDSGTATDFSIVGEIDSQAQLLAESAIEATNGDLLVAGLYSGESLLFGADDQVQLLLPEPLGENNAEGFVVRFDSEGGVIWSNTTNSPGHEKYKQISTWGGSDLAVIGTFSESTVWEPEVGTPVVLDSSQYNAGSFVARLDMGTGALQWIAESALLTSVSELRDENLLVGGQFGGFVIDRLAQKEATHEQGFDDATVLEDGTVILCGTLLKNDYIEYLGGVITPVGESDGFVGRFIPL